MTGERGGGVDGTGGKHRLWDISGLSGTTEGEAPWAIERDLGQRAGAPGRGGEGVPADAWDWGLRLVNLPGLQPGLQRGRGHLGMGERGGDGQPVPGKQGGGAR